MRKRNVCARCGWHWMKHVDGKCPKTKPNPDGSKPRFVRKKPQENSDA